MDGLHMLGQSKSDQQDDIVAVFSGIVFMCSVKTEMALLLLSAGQFLFVFNKDVLLLSFGEGFTKLIMAFKKNSSVGHAELSQDRRDLEMALVCQGPCPTPGLRRGFTSRVPLKGYF